MASPYKKIIYARLRSQLTYRTSFGQPDAAGRQPLQLRALADAEAREDSAGGELVLEGTTGETSAGDA